MSVVETALLYKIKFLLYSIIFLLISFMLFNFISAFKGKIQYNMLPKWNRLEIFGWTLILFGILFIMIDIATNFGNSTPTRSSDKWLENIFFSIIGSIYLIFGLLFLVSSVKNRGKKEIFPVSKNALQKDVTIFLIYIFIPMLIELLLIFI